MIKTFMSILLLSVVALSGCVSKHDATIATAESTELAAMAKGEETRVVKAAETHNSTLLKISEVDNATSGEKILGYALVNRDTTDLMHSQMPTILKVYTRSKKSTDVQIRAIEGVEKIAPFVMGTIVPVVAIRADKGSVSNSTVDGDVTNSLDENHATGVGDNSPPHNEVSSPTTTEVESEVSE
jgi:hypothetical protein